MAGGKSLLGSDAVYFPGRRRTQQKRKVLSTSPLKIPPRIERKTTEGMFYAPKYVIENASLFPRAELLLVLMVHRLPPDDAQKKGIPTPVSISLETWKAWTGLKKRALELAVDGLKDKGLQTYGKGEKARFYWDESICLNYIRQHSIEEKARTKGRAKSVTAPGGMKIHPDCLNGCRKLCDTQACESPKVVSITVGTGEKTERSFSQPVSQTACNSQIQQDLERKGETWDLSLQAVQKFFPAADSGFLKKLLLAVKQKAKTFTDEQLAFAINRAHKRNQASEGLFLQTVPAVMLAITDGRIQVPQSTQPKSPYTPEQLQAHLARHSAALKKSGMDDLAQRVHLLDLEDLEKLDDALCEIESAAIDRLRARAPVDVIRAAVEPQLKPYLGKMTPEQVDTVRQRKIGEKLLADAGLSRMSLYYL